MKRAREELAAFHHLCAAHQLSAHTLTSGQAFRWRQVADSGTWRAPLGQHVFSLRFDALEVLFAYEPTDDSAPDQQRAVLRDYFRLDADLAELAAECKLWSAQRRSRSTVWIADHWPLVHRVAP